MGPDDYGLRGAIVAVSRRIFLQQGVLAAAACATTPLLALSPQRPVGGDDQTHELPSLSPSGSDRWQNHAAALDHLGRAQFSSEVGTAFKVTVEGNAQPVWVTLLAVEDLPALVPVNPASFAVPNKQAASVPATSGFILRFGSSAQLQQGTYLFEHDSLGRFALLIVPQGNGQQTYVATVNRLQGAVIAAPQPPAGSNGGATPATSSGTGTLPRALSGSPGVQRAAVRD
jgi:hypothetical protein